MSIHRIFWNIVSLLQFTGWLSYTFYLVMEGLKNWEATTVITLTWMILFIWNHLNPTNSKL